MRLAPLVLLTGALVGIYSYNNMLGTHFYKQIPL